MFKQSNRPWPKVVKLGVAATACAVLGFAAFQAIPWMLSEREETRTFDLLRQGGYVIYLRHADRYRGPKEPFDANSPLAAFDDCTQQRDLTPKGRQEANRIGETFRDLQIPIGRVLALPLCRTRDTAQLAFGAAELDPHLYDPRYVAQLLGERPSRGNLVMVDSNYQIRKIAHVILQTGEAAVFQPLADGGYKFIGKLDQGDLIR
jgi:hypothetical protein